MSDGIYSTDKILYHDDARECFQLGKPHELNPIFVHLMIQNVCNQSCHFCSYRLKDWKNSKLFDTSKHIPIAKLLEIVDDLEEMGAKAVEITGGGEPLAYPQKEEFLRRLSSSPMEVGLVTNGTLLTEDVADLLFDTNLRWVRISIDAGDKETYSSIRSVRTAHWDKAWDGVARVVKRARDRDVAVGLGFVTTDENYHTVDAFLHDAAMSGVDNVRISFAFTPKGDKLLSDAQIEETVARIGKARQELAGSDMKINDLFLERHKNLAMSPEQNYDYCGSKDVLCVIEGECNVYTCCTLTGDPRGKIGNIRDQRFFDLWSSTADWRRDFDVRKRCKVACLYEKRNATMTQLMEGRDIQRADDPPPHTNFI